MKFTAVFAQTVEASAAIETVGVTVAVTVMVTALLATTVDEGHIALLVNCNVMTSPVTNALDVYVEAVAPEMFTPFFFHWYNGDEPPLVIEDVN